MESEKVQVQVQLVPRTNKLNALNLKQNVKKSHTKTSISSCICHCFVALQQQQQLKYSVIFFLALNICCMYLTLFAVQAAPPPNQPLQIASETQSYAPAWPPNLQHIDIWNAVELSTDAIEHASAVDSQVLQQVHTNEAFQFGDTDSDMPVLNVYTNAADDAVVETTFDDAADDNREQMQRKLSTRQRHGILMKRIEKHLENNTLLDMSNSRQDRVIHLFPVPVDGECLSDDGRRIGNCFNAYECRAKGGIAKGECAMGFGVCCIFIASCNTTISNNITYLVSPQFPSFMPSNYSVPCYFKIELMGNEVSQLRIDFYHFSMGQPNRRTGICDGDVFAVNGGPSGELTLCGQNSGQHVYYEIGGAAAPRQTLFGNLRPLTFSQLYPNSNSSAMPLIEISMNFTQRFQPIRLWEIRISQIPFSQRAPVGCLQYHTGVEGIVQTFNFAENGRHLANQNYRICMRQEQNMCSIMYQPCDEQSFRIGPSTGMESGMLNMGSPALMMDPMLAGIMGTMTGGAGAGVGGSDNPPLVVMSTMQPPVLADDPNMMQMMDATTTMAAMMTSTVTPGGSTTNAAAPMGGSTTAAVAADSSAAPMPTEAASSSAAPAATEASSAAPAASEMPAASSQAPVSSSSSGTTLDTRSSTTPATLSSSTLSDEVADEGSGGGDEDWTGGVPTRRPGPVRGGFDLFGFLRSAFDFNTYRYSGRQMYGSREINGIAGTPRTARQLYSRCTDRLTMPCIVEDFIGMGPLGSPTLPGCEPVHCGSQFCSSGAWPCRTESTVTPFYIGVHFGSGTGKGSAEDNIGACLRYQQVECM